MNHEHALPGSHRCIGCNALTFRAREDQLCPRCAYDAEQLIAQIEAEMLADDLALMTRFDAYCDQRDRTRVPLNLPRLNVWPERHVA